MITIIQKGNKHEIRCQKCNCLFSYEDEDINHEQWGMNEYKDTIKCPECKNELVIVGTKGF